ncbi:MAG TPA: hypothetical protein VFC47_14655 [Caulobacteraceae bacterium]|nr:hypothetical protein [Caulobacteraceae bacterium]
MPTRPGRFLRTGSASLMMLPRVADSLAGRMETVVLLPLAQSEIARAAPPAFLARAFRAEPPEAGASIVGDDLVEAVLAGGYPEALARKTWGVARTGISTMSMPSCGATSAISPTSINSIGCRA